LVKPADESTLTTGTNVNVPNDVKYEVDGTVPTSWTKDNDSNPTKYTLEVSFKIADANKADYEFDANGVTFNTTGLTDITAGSVTVNNGVATVTLEVAADKVTAQQP